MASTSMARPSTASLALPSTQNRAPVLEFRCLYTYDIRRKNQKRWQDGILRYHTFNQRVMVYDTPHRNSLGDTHWQDGACSQGAPQEGDGISIERAGMLVEVADQIGEHQTDLTELFDSRKKTKERNDTDKSKQSGASSNDTSSVAPCVAPRPSTLQPRSANIEARTPARTAGVSMQLKSPYEMRNGDKDADLRPPPKKPRTDDEHIPLFQILRTSRAAKPRRPPGMTRLSTTVSPAVAGKPPAERKRLAREEAQRQRRLSVKETIDLTSSQSDHPQHGQGIVSPGRNATENGRSGTNDRKHVGQGNSPETPQETRPGWFQPPANIAQGHTVTISKSGAVSKSALNFPAKHIDSVNKPGNQKPSSRPPPARSKSNVLTEAQAACGTKSAGKGPRPAREISRTAAQVARASSTPVSTAENIPLQQDTNQRTNASNVPDDTSTNIDDGFTPISQCDLHNAQNQTLKVQEPDPRQSPQKKRETKTTPLTIGTPKETTAKRKAGLLCQSTASIPDHEKKSKKDAPKKPKKRRDSGIELNNNVNADFMLSNDDVDVHEDSNQAPSTYQSPDRHNETQREENTHAGQIPANTELHQTQEALNTVATSTDITALDPHQRNSHVQAEPQKQTSPSTVPADTNTSDSHKNSIGPANHPVQRPAGDNTFTPLHESNGQTRQTPLPAHTRLDAAFLAVPRAQALPRVSSNQNTDPKPKEQRDEGRTLTNPIQGTNNRSTTSPFRRHQSDPCTLATNNSESRNRHNTSTANRPTEQTAKPPEVLKRPFRRVETAPAPAPAALPSETNEKERQTENAEAAAEETAEQTGPWTVEAFDLFGLGPRGVPEFVRKREGEGVVEWMKYVGDGAGGGGGGGGGGAESRSSGLEKGRAAVSVS